MSLKALFYLSVSVFIMVGCGTDDSNSSNQDGSTGDNSEWFNNSEETQGDGCGSFGDSSLEISALSVTDRNLICENAKSCFYNSEEFLSVSESICLMTALQTSTDQLSCEENATACVISMTMDSSGFGCDSDSFTECNQTVEDLESCVSATLELYQSYADSISQLDLNCALIEDEEALAAIMLQAGDIEWEQTEPYACQLLDESCP
jgi:hypothetical protein